MSEYRRLPPLATTTVKCIVFRGRSIPITLYTDNLWRDPQGTVMGFEEKTSSDPVTRCGVGVFSLPTDYWMTPACAAHDYAYNSLAWQAFHSREETDKLLTTLGNKIPGHEASITPEVFTLLSNLLGSRFWENETTR